MIIQPTEKGRQAVRTVLIQEVDAVVALIGSNGTRDCIQKATLAGKPVFPIAVAGGAAKEEWQKLKARQYSNMQEGDIEFLADRGLDAEAMAQKIAQQCKVILEPQKKAYSRRIFIVHGHDVGLKNELARLLERLEFTPIILHEQPDQGRTIFRKLNDELKDVGYAFVLLTPDDVGALSSRRDNLSERARQNVVFEHGLLIGVLGQDRVCAIVKGNVEIPSDLHGVLYLPTSATGGIDSIALSVLRELRSAGYQVDANKI
jgi:predicted nucleotide-binding protein